MHLVSLYVHKLFFFPFVNPSVGQLRKETHRNIELAGEHTHNSTNVHVREALKKMK